MRELVMSGDLESSSLNFYMIFKFFRILSPPGLIKLIRQTLKPEFLTIKAEAKDFLI